MFKTKLILIIVLFTVCIQLGFADDKSNRLSSLIQASDKQNEVLELTCQNIQENWDSWMSSDSTEFFYYPITEKTYITVHPSAREVCIFLEGHTKLLGEGAFKRVDKGLSYISEEEIAVAMPHALFDKYINSDSFSIHQNSFEDSWSDSWSNSWNDDSWDAVCDFNDWTFDSSDFSDWSYDSSDCSDWWTSDFSDWLSFTEKEPKMLEEIQGCRCVLQLYFVSYHVDPDYGHSYPLIVGKYYNGGTLGDAIYRHEESISFKNKLLIAHDILLALNDIHSRCITHCDLHPWNILLQKNSVTGAVEGSILADFGLAKSHKSESKEFLNQASWDVSNVRWILKDLFAEKEVKAFLHEMELRSSQENYKAFLALLPELVDEQAQEQITAHAKQKKRQVLKRANVIKWF